MATGRTGHPRRARFRHVPPEVVWHLSAHGLRCHDGRVTEFVGRSEPLARLVSAYGSATADISAASGTPLVLVTGEAGIGKTALLRRFVAAAEAAGATVAWGTSWDDEQAPAWWPWTEALRQLVSARPGIAVPPTVVALLSDQPVAPPDDPGAVGGRLRLLGDVGRLLSLASVQAPVVVVLDDLQWSDLSTLDLLRFLVRRPAGGRLLIVGGHRPGEARGEVAAALAELAMTAELIPLQMLNRDEVGELVRSLAGADGVERWSAVVHSRSTGHPFFARELCRLLMSGGDPAEVPPAVREVILRRLDALSPASSDLLATAAVAGPQPSVDLLADITGRTSAEVQEQVDEGVLAGAFVQGPHGPVFGHDLYRESVLSTLPAVRRAEVHRRVVDALLARRRRGVPVAPGDLARHATAALSGGAAGLDVQDVVGWAREAADLEEVRFAFVEAAALLERVRRAATRAGVDLAAADRVDLLVAESDLRLKAGDAPGAHALLEEAWSLVLTLDDAALTGSVALGLDRCGARFAMPREHLLGVLESARAALEGTGVAAEAEVTAALARQLQHSVPADRPRARPLADAAVEAARRLGEPTTLASCLLAQHDSLWTPGTAQRRVAIAQEIAGLARVGGDRERHAQALLLTANAQLESGSPSFRATLQEYLAVSRMLRQPRHDYLVRTREAALALLDGDIERGDRLSAEAAELGHQVGENDTGNVRMSQRLEVVRALGGPEELRAMATEAIDWWVGAPAHAHAVAAGFLAKAGDLDACRRELDTVLALDDWRADRSYLWSVFVGQVAAAAIAVRDLDLCRRLVDDLRPLRSACAVNGALVCFMGAHAHHLGLLQVALGDRAGAGRMLTEALRIHQRLGARVWEAETAAALRELEAGGVSMQQKGGVWEIAFAGHAGAVRHSKGLQDLAFLVARPGVDVPALDLMGAADPSPGPGSTADPVLDRTALAAYRSRLADLDDELAAAQHDRDRGRADRASTEREQLLSELRRSTRPGGSSRGWDNRDAERARKAVSARIRDAISRIDAVLPELATHLDRSVTTGMACRYEPSTD